MPKLLLSLLVIVFTSSVLWSTPVLAQGKDTWTGEVIDLVCYVTKGATGADNKECGLTSVKNGQPMGLLTDDGTLVLLAADHKDSEPYEVLKDRVGERTQVTGKLAERDGMKVVIVTAWKADK